MHFEPVKSSEEAIELENKHGAHNYHPLPVVLEKGVVASSATSTSE